MPTKREVQDKAMRVLAARAIATSGYKSHVLEKSPEVFHETLILFQERNWITPEALADKLGLEESSTSWFSENPSVRPELSGIQMEKALQKVREILEEANHAND